MESASSRRARRIVGPFVAVIALLATSLFMIPSAAAATALGQAQTNYHCSSAPYSVVQLSSDGPNYAVPGNGWLTSWSVMAAPLFDIAGDPGPDETVRFEVWKPLTAPNYQLVYISPTDVSITHGSGLHTFALSPPVAVSTGDVLGLVVTSANGFCLQTTGSDSANVFGANFDATLPGVTDTRAFVDLYSQYGFFANIDVAANFVDTTTLTVHKAVVGTPPSNTTYTVNVSCTDGNQILVNQDLMFDAHGRPIEGTDLEVTVPDTGSCTVTETVAGDASSVEYSCVWTPGGQDNQANVGCPGTSSGPSDQPATVTWESNGDTAQVTVTNTFPPPVVPPLSPPVAAPAAVVVRPAFTG